MLFFYNLHSGISNIIRWMPVLYKDRDYDHSFILRVLRFKLQKVSEYFKEHGISEDNDKNIGNIDHAIYLLDRLIEEDYCDSEYKALKDKYSEYDFFKDINNPKYKKYREGLSKIFKKASKEQDLDKKELFKLLNDHIEKWWD